MVNLRNNRREIVTVTPPQKHLKDKLEDFEEEFDHRDDIVGDFFQEIKNAVEECSGSSMEVCDITVSGEFFTLLGRYLEREDGYSGRAFEEPSNRVQIYGVLIKSSEYFRHSPSIPQVKIRCEECGQEPFWSDGGPYCPICE